MTFCQLFLPLELHVNFTLNCPFYAIAHNHPSMHIQNKAQIKKISAVSPSCSSDSKGYGFVRVGENKKEGLCRDNINLNPNPTKWKTFYHLLLIIQFHETWHHASRKQRKKEIRIDVFWIFYSLQWWHTVYAGHKRSSEGFNWCRILKKSSSPETLSSFECWWFSTFGLIKLTEIEPSRIVCSVMPQCIS